MEIPLDEVGTSDFSLCDDLIQEVVEAIAGVLKERGHSSPIVVFPSDDDGCKYQVIAGCHRLEAAKILGWEKIDAKIKDFGHRLPTDYHSPQLEEKVRDNEIDELCWVLSQEYQIPASTIGAIVGLSRGSVRRRVRLLDELEDSLCEKFKQGELALRKGLVIRQLPTEEQPEFYQYMIENRWSRDEARSKLDDFQANTIVTIGAEGNEVVTLMHQLRDSNIDVLVDVRSQAANSDGDLTADQLKEKFKRVQGIGYQHKSEYSPSEDLLESYESGEIDDIDFEKQYRSSIRELSFTNWLTTEEKVALLGPRKFAKPNDRQDHFCHRYYFARELIEAGHFQRMYDVEGDGLESFHPVRH